MPHFEHTVEIARPVREVFAFVTEPLNYPRWQPSLVEVHPHRRGSLRPGTEVTEVRRFLGREMETVFTCTRCEPPELVTIESPDGPVPFRATFALAPAGRATCFTWSLETRGAVARLAGPVGARATRGELERNATRLKALLEGERAQLARASGRRENGHR